MSMTRFGGSDRQRLDRSKRGPGPGRPDERDGDQTHPSFLALDRAALGSRTAELSRHLDVCARCRAYVDRIAEPAAVPAGQPLWPEARPGREAAPYPAPRRVWMGAVAVVAVAALLLVAILVGRDRPLQHVADRRGREPMPAADGPASMGTGKGGPAVGVYIRRGHHTFLWNGTEPVEPGDGLRIKLVPDGMTQVHVFSEEPRPGGVGLSLLHRADLAPDRDVVLDAAWRVDGAGGREVLVVVLSARPLSIATARAAAQSGASGHERWVTRLVLPKRRAGDARGVTPDAPGRDRLAP